MDDYLTVHDLENVEGKVALVRVDLNVPVNDGKVSDTTRIDRILPTIEVLQDKGLRIVLLSHFGRPKGQANDDYSLAFLAPFMSKHLGINVTFGHNCIGADSSIAQMNNGDVLLLENLRFHKGEEDNDPNFVAELAQMGDIYVNDAFSVSHRAHASTDGLARALPAFAGCLMDAELAALRFALEDPKTPVAAIVGGAKISTKIELLENLIEKVHYLVLGGGMANTFLAARGADMKTSLCEHDMLDIARNILDKSEEVGCRIILPVDLVCAKEFKAHAANQIFKSSEIADDYMALDIGPSTIQMVEAILNECRTLLWNGPLGAFEIAPFDQATTMLAGYVAQATRSKKLVSVAGGGDTVAALKHARADKGFTYLSSAGGAFLEWLEGKELPGVVALSRD